MSDVTHISSLLLTAEPSRIAAVVAEIETCAAVEVALTDPSGKIIVTLETPSEAEIVGELNRLSLIDGVVSAALVYHQSESGLSPIGQ